MGRFVILKRSKQSYCRPQLPKITNGTKQTSRVQYLSTAKQNLQINWEKMFFAKLSEMFCISPDVLAIKSKTNCFDNEKIKK